MRIDGQEGAEMTLNIPRGFQSLIYLLDGQLQLGEGDIYGKDMAVLIPDLESYPIKVKKESRAILLAGEPIKEKVSSYGPFVMNTQTEIMEALRDYQMGKMGILIED